MRSATCDAASAAPDSAAAYFVHLFGTSQSQDQGGETGMKKGGSQKSKSPSQLIDARIKELGDWRGKIRTRLRNFVKQAHPASLEGWEGRGGPGWGHAGLIFTGGAFKKVGRVTLAHRA